MSGKVEWSRMSGCIGDPAFGKRLRDRFKGLGVGVGHLDVFRSFSISDDGKGTVNVYCTGQATPIPKLEETKTIIETPESILTDYCQLTIETQHFAVKQVDVKLSGALIDKEKLSVIALPARSDVEPGEGAIATTPRGGIPYTFYGHILEEDMVVIPVAGGRDEMSFLKNFYFVGLGKCFSKQAILMGESLSPMVKPPVIVNVPRTGGDMFLSFTQLPFLGGLTVPEGVYSVGHCVNTGGIKFRINDDEKVINGDFNAGDLYLLNVADVKNITTVAIKYPNRSLKVSTNMYLASRRKKIQFEYGTGNEIRFVGKNFQFLADEGLTSLCVSMPTMYGSEIFSQSFVTGRVDVIRSGSLYNPKIDTWGVGADVRSLIDNDLRRGIAHDHYVPFKGRMVSRSRPMFMPEEYEVGSYIGDNATKSRVLVSHLLSGKRANDPYFKQIGYGESEINRMLNDMSLGEKKGIGGKDPKRHVSRREFTDDFDTCIEIDSVGAGNKILEMIDTYGVVFVADISRELKLEMEEVCSWTKNLLMHGLVVVDPVTRGLKRSGDKIDKGGILP